MKRKKTKPYGGWKVGNGFRAPNTHQSRITHQDPGLFGTRRTIESFTDWGSGTMVICDKGYYWAIEDLKRGR